MRDSGTRAIFGFVAAAISVLTFHQAMWAFLHFLNLPGMGMPPPYPTAPVPPWGVPRILDLAFWGGLYGILFGLALPRFFVVAPLKGSPVGGGWQVNNWMRSLLINGFWGIGVGLILPLILPRSRRYA